ESSSLQDMIDSLLHKLDVDDLKSVSSKENTSLINTLKHKAITVGSIEEIDNIPSLLTNILSGQAALIVDNLTKAITVNIPGQEKRSIEEPQSATLIKGPRDGFTETLSTHTSLLIYRIRRSDRWLESYVIGKITKTDRKSV